MRIIAASGFEAGSQFASVINTVKNAQGFASLGHKVTFICRQSQKGVLPPQELAEIYGLKYPMTWIQLPLKVMGTYRVDEHWGFARASLPYMLLLRPDVVYARSYIFPWLSSKLGIPTIAESHADKDVRTAEFLKLVEAAQQHKFLRLWVTMSQNLADHYQSLGVPEEKIYVTPNGVDLDLFSRPDTLPPSPYPKNRPNVVYAGHLYEDKGTLIILEAAKYLPNIQFHFVGGRPEDIEIHKNHAAALGLENITFYGLKPQKEVPPYLWHADALLLPYPKDHPRAKWMNPIKLAEYLASGVPVVITDAPSFKLLVTTDEAEFVKSNDPLSLAQGIERVITDHGRASNLIRNGLAKAKNLSFERRAKNILSKAGLTQ